MWIDFRLGPQTGILDWYTVLVGLTALFVLTLHGALWVALKTEDAVNQRARQIARRAWWFVAAFTVLITVVTFRVQPQVPANLSTHTGGYVFPALALAGLFAIRWYVGSQDSIRAFLGSCAYIVGMLTSVVFGVYPYVLPASTNAAYALTVHNAKAADYGLKIGLLWWVIGIALAVGYLVFAYRHLTDKVKLEGEGY